MKKPNGREGLTLAASDIEDAAVSIRSALKIAIADPGAAGLTHTWCTEALKALEAMLTKSSTSEGDQLSEEVVTKMIWDRWPRIAAPEHKTQALQYMDFRHGAAEMVKLLRDHGLLSDPRRSKMVEAGNVMRDLLDSPWFPYEENRDKAIVAWDAAIGGEDGGGPLSGDGLSDIEREVLDDQMEGLKHRLGASAETADRSTPPAGEDAEHPASPLRAGAQGPIDAVPAREADNPDYFDIAAAIAMDEADEGAFPRNEAPTYRQALSFALPIIWALWKGHRDGCEAGILVIAGDTMEQSGECTCGYETMRKEAEYLFER